MSGPAFERVHDALAALDCRPHRTSVVQVDACCPAHQDRSPSLSVTDQPAKGLVLLNCHTGCATTDVVAALGLTLGDLYDEPRRDAPVRSREVARYHYTDATGTVLFTKVRYEPKDFRITPRGAAGQLPEKPLYRLPEVLTAAAAGATVYVVEGEKDADALASRGRVATCNHEGAAKDGQRSKWRQEYTGQLTGAHVVVVADRDDPGRAHARAIAASLSAAGVVHRVVEAAAGKDVSDHLAAGHDLDALQPAKLGEAPSAPASPTSPTPLSRAPSLTPFPVAALPAPYGAMVAAVAEATQTDPGMAGTVALGCLAAAAGGRVEVKVGPDWREPLNLFTAVAAPPGSRKSAVLKSMAAPLVSAERKLVDEQRPRAVEAATLRDIAERSAEDARKAAGKATHDKREKLTQDALAAADAAAAITIPPLPRLISDDVTPEALATLLAEHGGRQAVISAEGGLFDILAGRYSTRPNLDAALKGHAGDQLRVDRRGRTEYVERPALTLVLAIQPAVLDSIGKVSEFAGRGLLARFLFSVPPGNVGARKVDPAPVPVALAGAYSDRLDELTVTLESRRDDPAVLALSPQAQALHLEAHRRHEPQLLPGGALGGSRLVVEWSSKLMGAVGRLAGLLHLAQHGPAHGLTEPISEATMSAALALGDYFTAHALAVFDRMGADPSIEGARLVLRHLHERSMETFTVRNLFTDLKGSRFPKTADLGPVLAVLEDFGWIEQLPAPERSGPGRPPSPSYLVHGSSPAETAQSAEPLPFRLSANTAGSAALVPDRRTA